MFRKLLCLLWLHKGDIESVVVARGDNWETSNHRFCCKYCDFKDKWTKTTTFGPIKFTISDL